MDTQSNLSGQENGVMELEHAIGYSGRIVRSVHLHPNGKDFIYISGGCIVVSDLTDPHNQHFLRGHDDQVTCLAVSNKGELVASGQVGDNSDVIIWDYNMKKARFRLSEHDHQVVCIDFSYDDKLLFSCGSSSDKKIFIWDTSNGYIVASTIMVPDPIICARWGGFVKDIKGRDTSKYQLATTGNKQICIWKVDTAQGQLQHQVINTGSTIRDYLCIDFSLDKEQYLYAGTSSGDFCIFSVKNMVLSAIIGVCAQGVTSIRAYSPDTILVGGGDGSLTVFKMDGAKALKIQSHQLAGGINSLTVSPDGKFVFPATNRGFVYRVMPQENSKVLQCENHTESVLFLTYPKGVSDKFASASADNSIRLWDVSEYNVESRIYSQNSGAPLSLIYSEEVLLSGWEDSRIRMHKIDTGNELWSIKDAHKNGVSSLCLSKNFKFICSGGGGGACRVWELRSREMVSNLKEHTAKVSKVQLWNDDLHLVSASRDKALLFWDLKSEKRVSAHIQRMGGINSFDIVPDTNLILSTGQDRKITFWDLRQSSPVRILDTNNNAKIPDECFDIAVSHNGKMFATGGSEQIVRTWDLGQCQVIGEGKGHSGTINSLKFSDDDKQLISGGKDGSIFLWNIFE